MRDIEVVELEVPARSHTRLKVPETVKTFLEHRQEPTLADRLAAARQLAGEVGLCGSHVRNDDGFWPIEHRICIRKSWQEAAQVGRQQAADFATYEMWRHGYSPESHSLDDDPE